MCFSNINFWEELFDNTDPILMLAIVLGVPYLLCVKIYQRIKARVLISEDRVYMEDSQIISYKKSKQVYKKYIYNKSLKLASRKFVFAKQYFSSLFFKKIRTHIFINMQIKHVVPSLIEKNEFGEKRYIGIILRKKFTSKYKYFHIVIFRNDCDSKYELLTIIPLKEVFL